MADLNRKLSVRKLRDEVDLLKWKILRQRKETRDATLQQVTASVHSLPKIQFKARRTLKGEETLRI